MKLLFSPFLFLTNNNQYHPAVQLSFFPCFSWFENCLIRHLCLQESWFQGFSRGKTIPAQRAWLLPSPAFMKQLSDRSENSDHMASCVFNTAFTTWALVWCNAVPLKIRRRVWFGSPKIWEESCWILSALKRVLKVLHWYLFKAFVPSSTGVWTYAHWRVNPLPLGCVALSLTSTVNLFMRPSNVGSFSMLCLAHSYCMAMVRGCCRWPTFTVCLSSVVKRKQKT